MYDFFSDSSYWKSFVLDNLLVTKRLFDRGFKVNNLDIRQSMFSDILEILFGTENVKWGPKEFDLPPRAMAIRERVEAQTATPEEEEANCYIESYVSRDHYKITVQVSDLAELYGKLRPKHYQELMDIFNEVSFKREEDIDIDYEEYFPWWELVEEIEWIKDGNKIVGFWLHLVDVESGTEEPVSDLQYNNAFIAFWDTLQKLKKEVANNVVLHKYQNPRRRFSILDTRRKWCRQGKADRAKHIA
ncbi:hypothetical protein ACOBQJ_03730 [Pelotomaculum propionicicum]|uniref:hypothetical protein n=1 Tax=Pelotomaculum propionicicum TaxID=258475 RepID=UPI003B822F3B